ncbi:MAG: hypothetical protein ACK53Y_12980, partial [bacterium]
AFLLPFLSSIVTSHASLFLTPLFEQFELVYQTQTYPHATLKRRNGELRLKGGYCSFIPLLIDQPNQVQHEGGKLATSPIVS